MPLDVLVIANTFLELAKREGRQLTNMQLQKLVYIAHGWSLALLRKPLFRNDIKAWEWGPVIPRLYNKLKKYGAGVVSDFIPTNEEPIGPQSSEMSLIEDVWEAYKDFTGPELSGITHTEGTPWSETWKTLQYGEIPNDRIAKHYQQLLNERTRPENSALS